MLPLSSSGYTPEDEVDRGGDEATDHQSDLLAGSWDTTGIVRLCCSATRASEP